MRATVLPIPGIVLGPYPERNERRRKPGFDAVDSLLHVRHRRRLGHYRQIAKRAAEIGAGIANLQAAEVEARLTDVRREIILHGFTNRLVAEALALVGNVAQASLGIRPFVTQYTAAAIMLDGKLAEMATGEGKTLAAAMCAAIAALTGIPVHVITANDYLVGRDAHTLGPLYRAMGLRVGAVTQQSDRDARFHAYACNVTYCTARQLAFDYLRDRLRRGRLRNDLQLRAASLGAARAESALLRGLCMAIVDEADSILIDEASVPLVLSESSTSIRQPDVLRDALQLAQALEASHFRLQPTQMQAELTPQGREVLEQWSQPTAATFRNRRHRDELVCLALAAMHLFRRDTHYLVRDGKVEIIDEATGRLALGRRWSRGLHQLVELKEGCTLGEEQVIAAQITYQRFFRRYLHLSGLSGTLTEARSELRAVYGLRVVKVPLRLPDRRQPTEVHFYPDSESRWHAVISRVLQISGAGRPVLIGTDSVADSEHLSRHLGVAEIGHAVLNARQDAAEAALVAAAGEAGQITVATNIAGRGTDIVLGAGVAERGGLHVICCQQNVSPRIDRQLIGRCARQGDPGSAEMMLAADSARFARYLPAWLRARFPKRGIDGPQWLMRRLVRIPQFFEEARRRSQRYALLLQDQHMDRGRMFGRPPE